MQENIAIDPTSSIGKRWRRILRLGRKPKEYHGYVDRFAVMRRCLYVEGWASHFDPVVTYEGKPLKFAVTRVDRPDLEHHFSPEARGWGFALSAMLPTEDIDRRRFELRLSAGLNYEDPAETFVPPADQPYNAMIERFKDAVRTPNASLLEIGSRARSGNIYREWFPDLEDYTGLDVVEGPNVDLVGDAHHLSNYVSRSYDFIFSIATFEHLMMPWKVAIEMNRVMRDDGLALIISHAAWPLHEEPWDFWRFSKEAWGALFNAHTGFTVLDAAYQHEALTVPTYIDNFHSERMSLGHSFLLSGCLVQKTGPAQVRWSREMSQIGGNIYGW